VERTPSVTPPALLTASAAILSVALWGSTFTVFKLVFRRVDPLAVTGVRYILLTSLAIAYLWWRRHDGTSSRSDRRRAALAGVFGYFMLEFFFALGLDRTTAVASAILVATHPIWGVTFSAIAARRRAGPREITGLAIGLGGVVVFVGAWSIGDARLGDLLSLAAAMSFGVYGAMVERLGHRLSEGELVARSMSAGGLLLIVVTLPAVAAQDWTRALPGDWAAILYTALGPILAGFLLWAWALRHRGMTRTAPFGYLEPIFAASLALAVLGEAIALRQVIGAVLVLAGVVLAAGRRIEPVAPLAPP
jgi:drug/metabolite transporter (DMT)-like permease